MDGLRNKVSDGRMEFRLVFSGDSAALCNLVFPIEFVNTVCSYSLALFSEIIRGNEVYLDEIRYIDRLIK